MVEKFIVSSYFALKLMTFLLFLCVSGSYVLDKKEMIMWYVSVYGVGILLLILFILMLKGYKFIDKKLNNVQKFF